MRAEVRHRERDLDDVMLLSQVGRLNPCGGVRPVRRRRGEVHGRSGQCSRHRRQDVRRVRRPH
eukprot:4429845-Heterocapsa_arctica.AAC.1